MFNSNNGWQGLNGPFEKDGTLVFKNDATVWDDLRIHPTSLPVISANSPVKEIITHTEPISTTAYSLSMDGTDGKGLVPYYSAMNTDKLSINVWIVSNDNVIDILSRNSSSDGFRLYRAYKRIRFYPGKGSTDSTRTARNTILNGGKYMVTVTCENLSSGSRVIIYIDGQEKINEVCDGQLDLTNTSDGYIIGENYNGKMDNLITYNKILTPSQITELFNSGAGINTDPSGIVSGTDIISKFLFDNNSNNENGSNAVMSGSYSYVDAIVDGVVELHSFGVVLDAYYPDRVSEVFFTVQFPHSKKMDSIIYPHVHWYGSDLSSGNVVWKLEYFWNQAGKKIGYSQIVELVIANDTVGEDGEPIQRMNNIPINGISLPFSENVSSTMSCRLYRDGLDSRDTYTKKVYLHEFDFHFEISTVGSREVGSK